MNNIFLTSDTHFGHNNICHFTNSDGSPVRPWDNHQEMDDALVENWNSVVKPNDKVYHLGDVVIKKQFLSIFERLNGIKVLIRGNHDIFKLKDYSQYFKDVRGCHVLDGLIFTHIPIHEESLGRFGCNVHGHLHGKRVMKSDGSGIDPRYHNVCVEQTNFTPIAFEDMKQKILDEGGVIGFQNGNGPTS